MNITLTHEQEYFMTLVQEGKNVLVDACIGSGKTTVIQELCNRLGGRKKEERPKILYLTYNTLLKHDAKDRIHRSNVTVTNYHGYASKCLRDVNISCGRGELISKFNEAKPVKHYDVLVIDEYQDIDTEISKMLEIIKEQNPEIQIIAVGDMEQKIYDKTSLDVTHFITAYLGKYEQVYFTNCFRINSEHAKFLSRVWNKQIQGVNSNCTVEYMSFEEAFDFLSKQNVEDVLCLGKKADLTSKMLNKLEEFCPRTYNKHTVYATITEEGDGISSDMVKKLKKSAIFTTYDRAKGLERPICVVFNFTEDYWETRSKQDGTKYEILRNLFCVAASRGKEHIIFVSGEEYTRRGITDIKNFRMLSEETLSTPFEMCKDFKHPFNMSTMFDFKYKEDIEECFSCIRTKPIEENKQEIIDVKSHDGFIDLSPCIGIYQEASYFTNYNIFKQIKFMNEVKGNRIPITVEPNDTLEEKILKMVAWETQHNRYTIQVKPPFVSDVQKHQIHERLYSLLEPTEQVQTSCQIVFTDADGNEYTTLGRTDVIKDNVVYELKFVSELEHKHFLQCACYLVSLMDKGIEKGILWNVRDNTRYEITIPDKDKFLKSVIKTITKGYVNNLNNVVFG